MSKIHFFKAFKNFKHKNSRQNNSKYRKLGHAGKITGTLNQVKRIKSQDQMSIRLALVKFHYGKINISQTA